MLQIKGTAGVILETRINCVAAFGIGSADPDCFAVVRRRAAPIFSQSDPSSPATFGPAVRSEISCLVFQSPSAAKAAEVVKTLSSACTRMSASLNGPRAGQANSLAVSSRVAMAGVSRAESAVAPAPLGRGQPIPQPVAAAAAPTSIGCAIRAKFVGVCPANREAASMPEQVLLDTALEQIDFDGSKFVDAVIRAVPGWLTVDGVGEARGRYCLELRDDHIKSFNIWCHLSGWMVGVTVVFNCINRD